MVRLRSHHCHGTITCAAFAAVLSPVPPLTTKLMCDGHNTRSLRALTAVSLSPLIPDLSEPFQPDVNTHPDRCADLSRLGLEDQGADLSTFNPEFTGLDAAPSPSLHHVTSIRGGRTLSPRGVTLLGAAANVLLSLLKLVVGTLSGSASLVADAYHSGSDLLVDAVTMVAVHAPPSFERAATLAIAGLLASAEHIEPMPRKARG